MLDDYRHRWTIYKVRNLESYMLEWLPNYCNQKTTQESTYIKENMSEINDIIKLPESIYLLLKP